MKKFNAIAFVATLLSLSQGAFAVPYGYVSGAGNGTVTVVDTATNTVVTTVTVGGNAYWATVSPDGSQAWISNNGYVNVIDTTTNTIIASVAGPATSEYLEFSPDGSKLWVASSISSFITMVDTKTFIPTQIPVGSAPKTLSVSPDGSKVYTANTGTNNVSVINVPTLTVVATVTLPSVTTGIAVSPDGTQVYVGGGTGVSMQVIDTATNTLKITPTLPASLTPAWFSFNRDGSTVYFPDIFGYFACAISTQSNALLTLNSVNPRPRSLATNPNGLEVYVPNNGSNGIGINPPPGTTVSVVSTQTNTVVATITVGLAPHFVSFYPDGTKAYVPNQSGSSVSVIDTASRIVIATIPVSAPTIFTFGIVPPPRPPLSFSGKQKLNNFGLLKEFYNQLSWTPSPSPNVGGYAIYRNGQYAASVGANTFQYLDHDRPKGQPTTYQITAISTSGAIGFPVITTVVYP